MSKRDATATRIYLRLREKLVERGHGDEIHWAEDVGECRNAEALVQEAIWCIIAAGMREQVAGSIYQRVMEQLTSGCRVAGLYKHKGKVAAIEDIWARRRELFKAYRGAVDKLAFLETLPWIGPVSKFHLARNLGMHVAKPDRHMVRIAKSYGMSPAELCAAVSKRTGHRIGVVDVVFWRAANLGLI